MEQDEKIKIENYNTMTNCNVFTGPVYGGVFPLPGSQPVINNFYGKEEPTPKEKEKSVPVETQENSPEARTQRKEAVLKSIVERFDFDDSMLRRDNNRKCITNDRLSLLFKRCFGIGAHPTRENMAIMETLWTLLADKRDKCTKCPNEDFFRQTVLNVLGYFRIKGVICGTSLNLTRAVFKDADANLAKNIERNITSDVFPKQTDKVLDIYIDKLMKGEL